MYTEEDLIELDKTEEESEKEWLAALLLLLGDTKEMLSDELIRIYTTYGHDGVIRYKDMRKRVSLKNRRLRIAELYATIYDILEDGFTAFEDRFKRHLTEVVRTEVDFFDELIDLDDILYKAWGNDELNWKQRLWNMRDKWNDVLCDDFLLDFVKNKKFKAAYEVLNKRFVSMDKALTKLLDSESLAMRTMIREEIFRKQGYKNYVYYTKDDEKTCEKCAPLHGVVFPFTALKIGVTAPPLHPHCRDWIVAVK